MTEITNGGTTTIEGATSRNLVQDREPNVTGNNNNNNRKLHDKRRDNNIVHVSKTYEGDTPEIGAVLGLQNENADKKVNFAVFCEKIGTYIMKEYKEIYFLGGQDYFCN